jgi:hypothetical protein
METLKVDWNQPKPTWQEAQAMCNRVELTRVTPDSNAVNTVLSELRKSHANGGAYLAAFRVGPDSVFDWYASRNRLLEWDILPSLLRREEIRGSLPELTIPNTVVEGQPQGSCSVSTAEGFKMESAFMFDGRLAQTIYIGGAYSHPQTNDGRQAKQMALDFCDALFEQRFSEVQLFNNFDAWTPWFQNIAWDWTAVLFDTRQRMLFILAVTDTD